MMVMRRRGRKLLAWQGCRGSCSRMMALLRRYVVNGWGILAKHLEHFVRLRLTVWVIWTVKDVDRRLRRNLALRRRRAGRRSLLLVRRLLLPAAAAGSLRVRRRGWVVVLLHYS